MIPFVEIENVTLGYSDELREPAVQDLSMSIEEGEFSAIVGPSGCGKSTLMKLVTGLLFPQAGQVRVDGAQVDSPLKIAGMAFQPFSAVFNRFRTLSAFKKLKTAENG